MKLFVALAAACLTATAALAQDDAYNATRATEAAGEATALAAATRDLCDQKLVLLGENGFHGDGRTAAFKADLVQRLVADCGFDTVLFEGSRYDFLAFSRAVRRHEPATRDMLSSAVGGLWNQNREMQPLIDFLAADARAGRVHLGGLDDQLGSRGAFYSLERMPAELAGYLPEPRREDCRRRIRQRIWSDYSRDAPYAEADRAEIRACLAEIDAAIAPLPDRQERADLRAMSDNIRRTLDRDFLAPVDRLEGRDASMFLNLETLIDQRGPGAKIIVWAANSHVAREPRASTPFAGRRNLGSRIHEAYGEEARIVGFTAAGGQFRYTVRTAKDVAPAPAGSLEAVALDGAGEQVDAVYITPAWLSALPSLSGGAFDDHQQALAEWSRHYDAVVVFRRERPPHRLDE